ncbi:hypothetical protein EG830_05515 [bacterium]|nr:hypothetical protein [bacterium]
MKQKIYSLGLINTSIIFLGALLKINHWPGGGQLLIIGIVMLVMIFLPLALRNHFRTEGERKNILLYIVTWLTCFVVFGGMLFKMMHWPGAGIALLVALPFPYVVFLPVFLIVTSRDRNFSIHNTVAVLFLLAGTSISSALLALNVSKERIDDSMRLSRSYNRIETVLDEFPAPAGQTPVRNKIDELLGIIDDYQRRIFSVEGMSEEEWNNNPWTFPRPEAGSVLDKALITSGENPTYDTRLQTGLGDLVRELQKSAANEEVAGNIPLIFDYKESPGESPDWTKGMFMVPPRVWSLIYLDGLETNLKLIRAGI